MTTRQIVSLIDDIDGSEATGTVSFSLDGQDYEIDLSDANAGTLRAALTTYTESARKITGTRPHVRRTKAHRVVSADVRTWAAHNGITLNPRGRVPNEIVTRYQTEQTAKALREAVHPTGQAPESPAPAPGTTPESPEASTQSLTAPKRRRAPRTAGAAS